MRILGIDPGLAAVGYGIIDYNDKKIQLVTYGSIKTEAGEPIQDRLRKIYDRVQDLAIQYHPETVSIERLFFARNVKTAIMVAHAQGAIMVSLSDFNIPIFEYTPRQIKQAMINIKATKSQVQGMVKEILGLEKIPKPNHAADALAAAICHIFLSKFEKRVEN